VTIRFINGLFGDNISLDAPVEWLDKESIDDKYTAIIADFYPRIDGKMYAIEIEQDAGEDMAIRIFKYTVGGAILHGTTAVKSELNIAFPQPCVVFLTSTKNTPQELTWNIDFFDGQNVTLKIPTIRLAELSVKEIAERDLLPIGQFYLRKFEMLTENTIDDFVETAKSLLAEVRNAVDNGTVPRYIGAQMEETIRKTFENTIIRSEQEVGFIMTTNINETLQWTDYRKVFEEIEEHGKAEGKAEGRYERDMEIAIKMFARYKDSLELGAIEQMLADIGISEEIIAAAREKHSNTAV